MGEKKKEKKKKQEEKGAGSEEWEEAFTPVQRVGLALEFGRRRRLGARKNWKGRETKRRLRTREIML